ARQAERRSAQLRNGRAGVVEPARLRALQGRGGHRDGAGALQGRRPGDPGPALGAGAGDARAGRRLDPAAREDRQARRARHQLARALEVLSRAAAHRRYLSGIRDRVLGGDVRAGRDAEAGARPIAWHAGAPARGALEERALRGARLRPHREHARGAGAAHPLRAGQMGKDRPRQEHLGRMKYPDLHDHLRALDKAGLLVTVDRAINKDTEMHPLVRWQFRGGIAEKDRKAFLFKNVVDSKGRKYDIPVVVGALAANREIYRLGIGCPLDKINETWTRAIANPVTPNVVRDAPCHEVEVKGLDELPIPISTPGWDIAPFTTLSQYITKDPDSGVQNMGIYRGQVKTPRKLGMNPSLELRPGIYVHWEKMKRRKQKL